MGHDSSVQTHLDYFSVVEHHPDKRVIDRELRKLDDRLFLDPEMDPDFGVIVWTVKYHMGAGQQPLLIADWRDPDTRRPLDLSWALWSRVKAREHRDPFKLRDEIKAENERMRELRAERQLGDYEEIVNDVLPRMRGTHSALFHRSQGLRMARDRARRQGRVV